jgi:hypothetical protein
MKRLLVLAAAAAAILAAHPADAVTIPFSFTNTIGNTPGTVTGEIVGVAASGFSQATSVNILSAPAALGLTLPLDILSEPGGTFTLDLADFFLTSGGAISQAAIVITANYTLPDYFPQNWTFCLAVNVADYCSSTPSGAFLTNGSGGLRVVSDVSPTFASSAVPVPGALSLFATGLAGLGWFARRRRKQTAA